ncbi:MAG TPA: hypothetical protein VEQ63_16210, partial [Bryobacteraceae bacterium]|nr:hypothetical protein [Bryobacteraceae bacterium]
MPASIGTISIVGAETPIGRELRERLQELKLAAQVQSIGAEDEVAGILTEIEGEPVVMTPLDADRLSGSEVVLCSGSARSTLKALELLGSPRQAAIIDLTSALDD